MIEYLIKSENAIDHWSYFNVKNHNVLDLGCGRWSTTKTDEFTSIYFGNNGANKVVGIDSNDEEIELLSGLTFNNMAYTVLHENIQNHEFIINLLKEHSITAIKCDIEGAESVLLNLTKDDLSNVSEFAIEHHSTELRDLFIKKVEEWGFQIKVKATMVNTPDFIGVLFCEK